MRLLSGSLSRCLTGVQMPLKYIQEQSTHHQYPHQSKSCWYPPNCTTGSRSVIRMASSGPSKGVLSPASDRHLIAVTQMTSTEDKTRNWEVAQEIIRDAAGRGAKMIFLPECFDSVARSRKETLENLEPINGDLIGKYRQLASQLGVWLSLGGLHEKYDPTIDGSGGGSGPKSGPRPVEDLEKARITHLVISAAGDVRAVYRKSHLFNLDIPGVVRLVESDFAVGGRRVEPPVPTPVGRIGLGVCYDVRFPEFAISMAAAGADILTYPSAFTVPTGLAHWETLLRARAIENQVYVVAAAQGGVHNEKRSSYGHAMIVDPWGSIIAQLDRPGYALAEVDHAFLAACRQKLPIWTDRRPELYGHIRPAVGGSSAESKILADINSQPTYQFGSVAVFNWQVFALTHHSIAFVNHRPVLPGHVLVASRRVAHKLTDLTSGEVADLFLLVQRVERALETEYAARSTTIAIQDGPDAGQSISHIHTHVVPRKPEDFGGKVNLIYAHLQMHDTAEKIQKSPALDQEAMSANADRLRKYFI